MKKRVFSIFLAVVCIIVTLSGCSPKTPAKSMDLVEMNTEPSYYKFPKTDWGMTPQEVMKAWDFNFEDVTINPQIRDEYNSVTIHMNLNKDIELIGESLTNVTFSFTYLTVSGVGVCELGLTKVNGDVTKESLENVKDAFEKSFGERPSQGTIMNSKANFGTLPDEKRQAIIDVFSEYDTYSDFNEGSEWLTLSKTSFSQMIKPPNTVTINFDGYYAAVANADYDNFNKSVDAMKNGEFLLSN